MSNIEQKHLELINQFNNIIDLIKGADTEEKIKMLKELPKLDADKMMNDFEEAIGELKEEDRLKEVKLKNDLQIANMLLIDDVITKNIDDSIEKGFYQITIDTGTGFYKDKKIDYIKEYIIPHLLKNNSDEDEKYSTFKNGYYYYKGYYEEQYEVEYNEDDTLSFNRVETSSEEEEEESSEEEEETNVCNDCKKDISFCRTIDSKDYCLKCAVKHEKKH